MKCLIITHILLLNYMVRLEYEIQAQRLLTKEFPEAFHYKKISLEKDSLHTGHIPFHVILHRNVHRISQKIKMVPIKCLTTKQSLLIYCSQPKTDQNFIYIRNKFISLKIKIYYYYFIILCL